MKKIITLLDLLVFYFIGNILFNIVFSITEVLIAKALSLNLNFFNVFINNTSNNFILYTTIYFLVIICFYFINLLTVKALNKKLKRRKTNEE